MRSAPCPAGSGYAEWSSGGLRPVFVGKSCRLPPLDWGGAGSGVAASAPRPRPRARRPRARRPRTRRPPGPARPAAARAARPARRRFGYVEWSSGGLCPVLVGESCRSPPLDLVWRPPAAGVGDVEWSSGGLCPVFGGKSCRLPPLDVVWGARRPAVAGAASTGAPGGAGKAFSMNVQTAILGRLRPRGRHPPCHVPPPETASPPGRILPETGHPTHRRSIFFVYPCTR